jgi:hypothetical protein
MRNADWTKTSAHPRRLRTTRRARTLTRAQRRRAHTRTPAYQDAPKHTFAMQSTPMTQDVLNSLLATMQENQEKSKAANSKPLKRLAPGLAPGTQISLKNIKTQSELNGRTGWSLGIDIESKRVMVQLDHPPNMSEREMQRLMQKAMSGKTFDFRGTLPAVIKVRPDCICSEEDEKTDEAVNDEFRR